MVGLSRELVVGRRRRPAVRHGRAVEHERRRRTAVDSLHHTEARLRAIARNKEIRYFD